MNYLAFHSIHLHHINSVKHYLTSMLHGYYALKYAAFKHGFQYALLESMATSKELLFKTVYFEFLGTFKMTDEIKKGFIEDVLTHAGETAMIHTRYTPDVNAFLAHLNELMRKPMKMGDFRLLKVSAESAREQEFKGACPSP